ncbi:hypothetical protein M0802_008556 [Mischocyttarus mexicanus]|nr:hypothetical protein M0802_008556 [Mischocyttarus mexicanus]
MVFPIEIWEQIFLYIDPVILTKAKIVCNTWKQVINVILKVNIYLFKTILAIGTSKGHIYFFNTDDLNNKSVYIANHMESVRQVKFLKNNKKIILASSCINDHVKFWDFKSKNLIIEDRGKLLCTSQSYCYTIIENVLIVQGCIPKTFYELPVNDIVAGSADCNKVYFYTEEGNFFYGLLTEDEEFFVKKFIEPPNKPIRNYYMFTEIAVCITGFSIYGKKWRFFNTLPIFHGRPTAVLIYGNLLILGIETGHVYIYYVNDWEVLHLKSNMARLIIVDNEPIISLNISTHFTDCLIAAGRKRVHFIHFM